MEQSITANAECPVNKTQCAQQKWQSKQKRVASTIFEKAVMFQSEISKNLRQRKVVEERTAQLPAFQRCLEINNGKSKVGMIQWNLFST